MDYFFVGQIFKTRSVIRSGPGQRSDAHYGMDGQTSLVFRSSLLSDLSVSRSPFVLLMSQTTLVKGKNETVQCVCVEAPVKSRCGFGRQSPTAHDLESFIIHQHPHKTHIEMSNRQQHSAKEP